METVKNFIKFIDQHPVVAIVAAWLVYRISVWNERRNVLVAIDTELDILHKYWLRTPWSESNIENNDYFVIKITTVAIDNAIVRGGTLFLNPNLIKSLVFYKQAISTLNQLIDATQSFQSNVELWDEAKKTEDIQRRVRELINRTHTIGIGDNNKSAGHSAYKSLQSEIEKEKNSRILPILWLLTGFSFSLFRLKDFLYKYF